MTFAVVRVRGTIKVKPKIKETMRLLGLNRVNHCIVIPDNPVYRGMLQRAKDYVTWGEIEKDTAEELLKKRSEIQGVPKLDNAFVKKNTSYKDIKEMASALTEGSFDPRSIEGMSKVFRLSPPNKGGYEGVKRSYAAGGALGYRGKEINKLLKRMI